MFTQKLIVFSITIGVSSNNTYTNDSVTINVWLTNLYPNFSLGIYGVALYKITNNANQSV